MNQKREELSPRRVESLIASAQKTYVTARTGLYVAIEAAEGDGIDDERLALAAVAYACDSLKASANAFAALLGQCHRVRR